MQGITLCLIRAISIAILVSSGLVEARRTVDNMNVIDKCWRTNPDWRRNRRQLATCTVGFAGKMTNNIGRDVVNYKVTDSGDEDPLNPRPGTLRYAMTDLKGKVWITFKRSMSITLAKPLLVSSFTTIDGRGVNVHIENGGCLLLKKVTNVIVHGLYIHDCKPQEPGPVKGPGGEIVHLGPMDGDAIRVVTSSKIWIDHCTMYDCVDGLIDVTRGSTEITISNNWFRFQDKVMLLGHDDGFRRDVNMRVTVAFNHFGPNCIQRMPRIRFGYAHVVNNLYLGWGIYAIGGSMTPSIKSQSNLFIAPKGGNKEITWDSNANGNFKSIEDVFENGASFTTSVDKDAAMRPNYGADQTFEVEDGRRVRALTKSAGALKCPKISRC
ncbi:Pectin lyase-like superfamily protein [Perilla frutescens var. hirtella]|nr:Pectin lyase-like superfamily protein [Perilla frutescens var. frutescens]KAH6793200.1 Pectin lyase-like superfamily protein [Perilla frutescens var. hirtella]